MKEIALTKGLVTLVDDDKYEELNKHKWYAQATAKGNKHYAVRFEILYGKQFSVRMHCEIMGHKCIDHIDRNSLNNQKYNLRPATALQNSRNRAPWSKSGVKGVHKRGNRFKAYITFDKKLNYLGSFKTIVEASRAYDTKALELFGEFAYLNGL